MAGARIRAMDAEIETPGVVGSGGTTPAFRRRLVETVERGSLGPLTLVSAPAGSGKSALVADWAKQHLNTESIAWMSASSVNDATAFWAGVWEVMARDGEDLAEIAAPATGERLTSTQLSTLGDLLAQRAQPLILVLDDADVLADPIVGRQVARVLQRSGTGLRLIVLTRVDPALPLARYRLEGSITEIRASALAFTRSEASALMADSGLLLTPSQVDALVARTRGWAAGLRFFAMSMAGRSDIDASIAQFTGDEGDVAGYLMSEVLDAQSEEWRTVLLKTSVVPSLTADLVEALTGLPHGDKVLDSLANALSLVHRVPGRSGEYRYPPLLQEFLQTQLSYERPDQAREAHALAAAWFAGCEMYDQAVQHAAQAQAWDDAARYLVEGLGITILLVEPDVISIDDPRPGSPAVDSAAAWIVRAAQAIATTDIASARHALHQARVRLDADLGRRTWRTLSLSCSTLDALIASLTGDVDAGLASVRTARSELRFLPRCPMVRDLSTIVACCQGRLLLWSGQLAAARAAFVESTRYAAPPRLDVMLDARGSLVMIEALAGHFGRIERIATEADQVARRSGAGQAPTASPVWVVRAWTLALKREPLAARAVLDQFDVSQARDPVARVLYSMVSAELLRQGDDHVGAQLEVDLASSHELPEWLRSRLSEATPAQLTHGRSVTEATTIDGFIVAPLTPREQEVLSHLAELLTTEEIAATMFVSINTVRTHVRSILRKLGVTRRNEAVRRAWKLHLLVPPESADPDVASTA